MNKNLSIFAIVVLFICVVFSGCQEVERVLGPAEESKNYIVVTVVADICVFNNTDNSPSVNEPVRIQIIKAGGERFDEVVTMSSEGCSSATAVFNLYNEQPIEAHAYPVNHPENYESYTLPWEVVKSSSIQGVYTWNTAFAFFI